MSSAYEVRRIALTGPFLSELKEDIKIRWSSLVEDAKPMMQFYIAVADYFLFGKDFAKFPDCLNINWTEEELVNTFWYVFGEGRDRLVGPPLAAAVIYGIPIHPNHQTEHMLFDEVVEYFKNRLLNN